MTDVAALAACANLHVLDLEGTGVMDVAALAACVNLHLVAGCRRTRADKRVAARAEGREAPQS